MDKIITLDSHFPTGEPTLQVVWRSHNGKSFTEKAASEKFASPAYDYIQSITPREGRTIVLVNALGAYESYDSNRNGDGFNCMPYRVGVRAPAGKPGNGDGLDGWITADEIVTRHYHTFEQAGIYQHHVNKDPGKSLGRVEKAFWNERMKRVELLLEIINSRQPELIQRINDGEYPAVSMGCRVKWDVCTKCGNRAPTRKEYCEHLRFQMNHIDPATGLRFCALNPSPYFFDISIVAKPADQTGYMLKKVAEHAYEIWSHPAPAWEEKIAEFEAKQATVRKVGDIMKTVIDSKVMSAKTTPDPLIEQYAKKMLPDNVGHLEPAGDKEVTAMANYPLADVIATLDKVGAFLATGELVQMLCKRAGVKVSSDHLNRVVLLQPSVIESFARYPDMYEKMAAMTAINPAKASVKLAKELGAWLEKRATMGEYLRDWWHRPGPINQEALQWGPGYLHRAQEPPRTDVMTMTDPNTGRTYTTTRGAAQTADAANRRAVLGGTAMLGGAYTLGMGLIPGLGHLPLLARAGLGLGAGYLSSRKLLQAQRPYMHAQYMTDQGTPVPGNTEFAKTSGAAPTTILLDKLAYDYVERLGGWPVGDRLAHTLLSKCADARFRAFVTGDVAEKVAALCTPLETPSYDPYTPPQLGIHKLSEAFGALIS